MADEPNEEQTLETAALAPAADVTAPQPPAAGPEAPAAQPARTVTFPRWGAIVGAVAIVVLLMAGSFAAGIAIGGHDDRGHLMRGGPAMERPGGMGMHGDEFGQNGGGMGMQGGQGMQGNGYGPGAQQNAQPGTTPAPSATALGK